MHFDLMRKVKQKTLSHVKKSYNLIKEIIPDVLVKGGDYDIKEIVGYQTVIDNGGQVKTLSFYDGYSSTNYIDKINKR